MTGWHVDDEALRRWSVFTDSMSEGASVEQHLLACPPCRARANDASQVLDLAAMWTRTRDTIEVPRARAFERLLRRCGLPANDARLIALSTAFRSGWLIGVGVVLAFAALAAAYGHARGLWLFLAVAPLVPCIAVAFSYDAQIDPALEPELVVPYSAMRLTLLRTITVLGLALPAVVLLGLVVPGQPGFTWLLPSVGFVAVVVAASTWTTPLRAAIAVSAVWLALVSLLATATATAPDAVARGRWQAAFLVLAAAAAAIFLLRRHHLRELRPWR
jgi:hypothetical protein